MKKPVLVIGGGIAGIQTSLDLAEMGTPVFIVEESPSIGGRMAQLDKTFPTNDCSACILAPKVTECFNHPLIRTLTWSELVELEGDAPELRAVVRKKARYIDEEKCKGCNDCTEKCPIEAASEFDMGVGERKAIYKPFAQAVPNKVIIDKKGTSPCKYECPAHIHAHGYVALSAQGRFEEGLALVREKTPFAGVLGRVCLHPCENQCSRKYVDDALPIASIKRYLADHEIEMGIEPEIKIEAEKKDEKVAIIGAGPAGLNCAYQLAKQGYDVTVFESLPKAGGMLRYGIPDYRLDKSILDREISIIEKMGVEIRTDVVLGRDVTIDSLKEEGYKAVYVAIGAHKDIKLGIPGEDVKGVISSVDFLREVNLGNKVDTGKKVLVVGGGNVAMDAARTALRLGCDVTVVYRRSREQMPANIWEIEHAEEEGVKFNLLSSPAEVISSNGKLTALRCVKNELGEPDKSGRRRPEPIAGSEFDIEADTIIIAIGQKVEDEHITEVKQICFDRWGTIECDEKETTTEHEGIFSGGDCVTGPATMIEAIAAGNRAAVAIQNYIEGTDRELEPELLPKTEIENIELNVKNKSGRRKMPMIDIDKRTNTFMEVETGFSEEEIINEANRCVDCSICSECMACVNVCQSEAVCHIQQDEIINLDIGAVIVAAGFDTSAEIPQHFGYDTSRDIVTSMEYERILSASGPFEGHVQRPSDGKAPKKIAFIQCAGSRDMKCDIEYCSAVCCMYAVKEAMITKEHLPSVEEIDIYYMDIRAYGKDFDKYIDSAKNKYGINFIKSRVSDVDTNKDGSLSIKYAELSGGIAAKDYDMVVLSVGLDARGKISNLMRSVDVKTDKYGFCWTNEFNPTVSSRKGIFTCGVAAGPKDIPETVIESSAAAASANRMVINTEIDEDIMRRYFVKEEDPEERDVSNEPIRMGVFVCHCGVNIGGYLSVDQVVEYAKELPFVVYADQNLYTCSVDAQKVIAEKIEELKLNRVVVASCTPRTHEPLFQDVLKRAGLNPYLFSMANIRDQCSWVHMDRYDDATEKAKDLVQMAISKGIYSKQLERQKIDVKKEALIIGGGMAGMSAALEIAGMGYKTSIIEKTDELGGKANNIYKSSKGRLYKRYIDRYIKDVIENDLIDIYLNSSIDEIDGYVGKFETSVNTPNGEITLNHGVIIVATGAGEYKPTEYLYGKNRNVITQTELEKMLSDDKLSDSGAEDIVMIQCVGSRVEERKYCSRVCCNQAVKNAIILKEENSERNITILYRDIRTYGFHETEYKKARQMGIKFVRYTEDSYPEVYENEGLKVKVFDEILDEDIELKTDLLVLASAIVPDVEENKNLAQMLKVPTNDEGFFLEAHVKLRPVDFATEGVYVCGLAHSPKNLRESIVQGRAAAARAATVISKDTLEAEGTIAKVNEDLCEACGECEKVCAYKAISIEEKENRGRKYKVSTVNAALCKGCGTCASTCRCGAIDVKGFLDVQVLSEIGSLLKVNS